MRTIKFRGKRVDNGEWVYGFYVRNEHMGVVKHIIITDWAQVYANSFKVIPETVGQCTGLKDKNGKEIYEGDIVKTRYSDVDDWEIYSVKYYDCDDYPAFDLCPQIECECNGLSFILVEHEDVEVIGNICENPELLKGDSNVSTS